MNDIFFLLTFILLSTIFAVASVIAAFICQYKSENIDESIYECGMKIFNECKGEFKLSYLNCAVLFLIFDVEAILLFPFALSLGELQTFVVVEVMIFISIMLYTLLFAIKKQVLRWK